MAATTILKSTLPIELPLWRLKLQFINFNQWRMFLSYRYSTFALLGASTLCNSHRKSAMSRNGSKLFFFWSETPRNINGTWIPGQVRVSTRTSRLSHLACKSEHIMWLEGCMRKRQQRKMKKRKNKSYTACVTNQPTLRRHPLTELFQIWRV